MTSIRRRIRDEILVVVAAWLAILGVITLCFAVSLFYLDP